MKTLTEMMLRHGATVDRNFRYGAERKPADRSYRQEARRIQAKIRAKHGFKECYAPIRTKPEGNPKLLKAESYSVGLTLQPYVTRFLTSPLTVNCCPNATPGCIQGCVVAHSEKAHLQDDRVTRARKAKTEFFGLYPCHACFLYGWELADEVDAHGFILNRPNVGSDAEWERILPSLTNGAVFDKQLLNYGYSKLPKVLDTDGWLDKNYRVAFSWNEEAIAADVTPFLHAGGSVAVVTDRPKGHPLLNPADMPFDIPSFTKLLDADKTDEWVFEASAIGDLSAKGAARKLIRKSAFIVRGEKHE